MTKFRLSFSSLLLLLALSSYGDDVPVTKPIVTGTRIAFLVGINSYNATTSLKYAVGDSEAIEDLLLRTGKYNKLIKVNDYGKITTTLNPETLSYSSQRVKMVPTKANIEATYQEVLAENPETLLFYYSGHGFIEGEGGENFIAPKDVDVKFEKRKVGKEEKQVPVPLNGISLKTMGIQAAKVKRVVFLIDACRSPLPESDGEEIQITDAGKKELTAKSAMEDKSKDEDVTSKEIQLKQNLLSTRTDKLPKRVLEAEGITMLIGAAPEVSSLEDEDFKSGIFTHFLKKAFNGGVQEENQEEYITEENLSRYIEDRFKQYYELRKKETETAAEPKLYNLTFDRGKKGEILISQHRPIEGKERIDKPIYTDKIRKREVKGKLVYNEKGEREDLRFFVHDKKRDVYYPDSLDGVYKMEYSFNKDNSGELEKFTATEFNLENEEVFEYGTKLIPNVGWEYRGIYNDIVETGIIGVETGLKPVSTSTELQTRSNDKNKIQFEKKIFDFNGNIISKEYFDANGRPLEFEGVSKIVHAYDKYGQVILEEFYSKDILDEYGDVTKKGKLIERNGFARYKAKYKSKGNLLLETWEDKDEKIVDNHLGYARTKYIYNKNDRLIRKKFYNSKNKPTNDKSGVSEYSYSYNSDCTKFYETKMAKKVNQVLLKDRNLEVYKLCLAEEIHTDTEGKPANDENLVYKKIRKFNQKGFLVSDEKFSDDGRRYLENAVAKNEYAHDDEGNIISQKNFGEFEVNGKLVPISDANGVHEYKYIYYDYYEDGSPLLNACVYQRKINGIPLQNFDCALKIERYGLNGKPIEDKNGVFTTNIYYTGSAQDELDRLNYSLKKKFLFRKNKDYSNTIIFSGGGLNGGSAEGGSVKTYDIHGKELTLDVRYKVINGREVLEDKREIRYDERNNKILDVTYEVRKENDGEEYISKKEELKYDERNNVILSVEFTDKFGTSWYRRMKKKYDDRNNKTLAVGFSVTDEKKYISHWKDEYKYDERNNITLEENYETKRGKEVLVSKSEYKYDEKNNKILEEKYIILGGKEVLERKQEWKYDKRNNKIFEANYRINDGKEVVLKKKEECKYVERSIGSTDSREKDLLIEMRSYTKYESYETGGEEEVFENREEYKYDENNELIFYAKYGVKEGKEVLELKQEWNFNKENKETLNRKTEIQKNGEFIIRKMKKKYDNDQNLILKEEFETKEGKELLVKREERKFDEKNNKILDASYEIKEGKEILLEKVERKFDDRNNEIYTFIYSQELADNFPQFAFKTKEGNQVVEWKTEKKYDDRNRNTQNITYHKTQDGKELLGEKSEFKYDERNNIIQSIKITKSRSGKELNEEKQEFKYDAKNNKILEATYKMENGEEVLIQKSETQYDEKNKKTFSSAFFADAKTPFEVLMNSGFRFEYYYGSVNRKFPDSQRLLDQLEKIKDSKDPKDELEKKILTEKLEPSKKYFEANEKRFTLTEEQFGKNEKLKSATYKLLFFNPRGPAEKRLMRVDLDQFYRPVKVGFEEE